MRYSASIEASILDAIAENPTAEVILPEWCYWQGVSQPWIYLDQRPVRLIRHLYSTLIDDLPESSGLAMLPGVNPKNVNPHLAAVTPTRRSRAACPKGHLYDPGDFDPKSGKQSCQECRAERALGESPTELNRQKTHCPRGHPYTKGNLVKLASGRRRCLICHREQQAEYRSRKGS